MTVYEFAALIVAFVSLIISIVAYRNSIKYQKHEYATRLELADELITKSDILGNKRYDSYFSSDSKVSELPDQFDDVDMNKGDEHLLLKYRADLVNKGSRPVLINEILGQCGSKSNSKQRMGKVLKNRFYLNPGDETNISFDYSETEVQEIVSKFKIQEYSWFLLVSYQSAENKRVDTTRNLGGPRVMVVQPGPILIPPRSRTERLLISLKQRINKIQKANLD